jgi:bacillithiol biosynthesis cysteine-adding enzyme BshC
MNKLFGEYGLVCIDGDNRDLKALFAPVIQEELKTRFSKPLLQQSSTQLEEKGFHAQLAGREINLFYLQDHQRERIVMEGDRFRILKTDKSFTKDEIQQELEVHPEKFSPNAVLRPLYQQTIIPALAYIGGGGELAYWLQLKQVFKDAGVFYPMLIMRNSVMILSEQQQRRIQKLGVEPENLFLKAEALQKQFMASRVDTGTELEKIERELEGVLEKLKQVTAKADPSLQDWAGAEGNKIRSILADIEKRIHKANKAKLEQELSQLDKLREQLFPGGELQERVQNGGQWYARYGRRFIETLLSLNPFRKSFTIMLEEEFI